MILLKVLIFFTFNGICLLNALFKDGHGESVEGFGRNSAPLIAPLIYEKKFKQKLDHFNKADKRTWEQLYFYKDDFYRRGGPVYLWIEVINPLSELSLERHYWHSHAKETRAFLFSLEHRFCGKSQPLNDTATENLRFVNASQALEDVAAFIGAMNEKFDFPEDTKWIVFGRFYGGNLAAWMRLKYPKLVHGAVASSAPLLAKHNIPEYLNAVGDLLATYDEKCQRDIKLANQKVDELVATGKGRKELENIFKMCAPLTDNKLDISYFASSLAEKIIFYVQNDQWGTYKEFICNNMLKNADTKKPIERLADLVHTFLNPYGLCVGTNFTEYVGFLKKSDVMSATDTERVWEYQKCTQFGWFKPSDTKSNVFSKHINLDFYQSSCMKIFKPSLNKKFITQATKKTNLLFDGLNIDVPRTIFVYGTDDPFKSLGITSTKNKKHINVITVEGGTRSSELGGNCNAPQAKKDAQKKIMAIIESWL